MVKANNLYLPVPIFPNVLAVVLPILSFLALIYNFRSSSKGFIIRFAPRSTGLVVLALFDTILVTVAVTILQPEVLECSIDNRWQAFWGAKNALAIKTLQEAFSCCGLHTPRDRAWPFHNNDAGACEESYGMREACEGPWKQQQRVVLGIWLAIGLSGLLIKVCSNTRR